MAFDYKKEYKEFYLPPRKPGIVTVPPMNFVSVQGRGDPNEPGGEYQAAMELLYGIAFTIKMSYKGSHKIDGYFEYVVPPLEQMDVFAREQGYETDFTGYRRHHEIYLSDPRRTAPEKLKTVLRHPVRAK